MTPEEEARIKALSDAYKQAEASGNQADMYTTHAQAESIRNQNGYSGGADGSANIPFSNVTQPQPQANPTQTSSYGNAGVSVQDNAKIDAIKARYAQAQASGNEADMYTTHAQAEAIRNQYGYSGGADGSTYAPAQTTGLTKSAITPATSQSEYINKIYEAQRQAAIDKLKATYDTNMNTLNTAASKIPDTYNTARNSTAAVSEQNKSAFNERAAATGLNNGAGGQAALAIGNTLTSNMSALDKQQASSVADIEAQRIQLSTTFKNAIDSAVSENDFAKAQALYEEATRVDNSLVSQSQAQASVDAQYQQYQAERELNRAQVLASSGDFSGYKSIYGLTDAQVASLNAYWKLTKTKTTSNFSSGSGGGDDNNNNNNNTPLFGDKKTPIDDAGTLKNISTKLSAIEDRNVSVPSSAAQIIQSYYTQGLISEATAKQLLAQYGL